MFAGSLRLRSAVVIATGILATAALGCERAPLDCPALPTGSLVVTEISGDLGTASALGEWIELFNSSGSSISLLGLRVELTTLDGGSTQEFTVRENISVGAGEYVTLGRFANGDAEATHIDYGYQDDLDASLLSTAALELFICGEEIDQVVYRDLPGDGSLAFDGAIAPTATANDDESNFCVDTTGGTPKQENSPCI